MAVVYPNQLYTKNRKFNYLLNLFSKITNNGGNNISHINNKLSNIQLESLFKINNKSRETSQNHLESLYGTIRITNRNNKRTSDKPSHPSSIIPSKNNIELSIENRNKGKQETVRPISKLSNSIPQIDRYVKTHLNTHPVINKNQQVVHISDEVISVKTTLDKLKKSYRYHINNKDILDVYLITFLDTISTYYSGLPINDKRELLKSIKIDTITTFNKEELYKKVIYSSKDFTKSDIEDAFMTNKPISIKMLKVLADTIDCNFIYIHDEIRQFITPFISNRATVILYEQEDKVYGFKNKDHTRIFIRGNEVFDIVKIEGTYNDTILGKMKLEELHNLAMMYNIETKKQGKVGKINIKKEELIEKIKEKLTI